MWNAFIVILSSKEWEKKELPLERVREFLQEEKKELPLEQVALKNSYREEKKELPLEQVALKSSYRRRNAECITVALSSKRVGEERNTFGESCLSFEDTLTLTQGVGEERLPFGEL